MRIFLSSLTLPKKAARRMQHFFGPDFEAGRGMKLSSAQQATAAMLGYTSWHELEQVTRSRSHHPSLLDEDVSPEEQSRRINFQAEAIESQISLFSIDSRRFALRLRVSARNPESPVLYNPIWVVNQIVPGIDPWTGTSEWRFFPSERSRDLWPTIEESLECWRRGFLDGETFYKRLWHWREAQPENLMVIGNMLYLARSCDSFESVSGCLDDFELAVVQSLPRSFPSIGPETFCPGLGANDVIVYVTYELAEGYYRLGNYSKALRWFNFTARTSKSMEPFCLDYLQDLRKPMPSGRVHKIDPQDREFELDI